MGLEFVIMILLLILRAGLGNEKDNGYDYNDNNGSSCDYFITNRKG